MALKRVVVTGLGALTPIGNSIEEYWDGLVNGRSGAAPITYYDTEKHKTKLARKFRQVSFKEAVVEEIKEAPEVEDFQVVKTKRFAVKPMDIQEAIMQMNLINHDFFVFRDAKTEAVNVVYRRKDGKYGLIDPEA